MSEASLCEKKSVRANPSLMEIAAYLGHEPSREILGADAPTLFSFDALQRGGDRSWRRVMQTLGHYPVAVCACAIATLAWDAYQQAQDADAEVAALAKPLVDALQKWQQEPHSVETIEQIRRTGTEFCLTVNVGGGWYHKAGYAGQALGRALGLCYSVALAPENPRYVRWLGEAVEILRDASHLREDRLCRKITASLLPFCGLLIENVDKEISP